MAYDQQLSDALRELEQVKTERDALARDLEAERHHRRAVEDSEQALAAHVERWHDVYVDLTNNMVMFDGVSHYVADNSMMRRFDEIDESAPTTSLARHPDDAAVDRFAAAMKAKLADARAKGRDGWDNPDLCPAEFLATLLVGHIGKANAGNLEDIAALAMMLHQRGDDPAVVAQAHARLKAEWQAEALEAYEDYVHGDHVTFPKTPREFAHEIRRQAEEGK